MKKPKKEIQEEPPEKETPKNRGVLIMAIGDAFWGKLAYNLLMSLRVTDPTIRVSLAHHGTGISHLAQHQRIAFDNIIQIPDEYVHRGDHYEPIKAKMFMYKLSPYQETLFLDADLIWLPRRSVSEFFSTQTNDLAFQCRGLTDISINTELLWCRTAQIRQYTGINKGAWHNLSSEAVYFKKTKETAGFFRETEKEYDKIDFPHVLFNGSIPDELPFGITLLKNSLKMNEWHPVYWEHEQKKRLEPAQMYQNFWAYSMGGNHQDRNMKNFYDNLVKYYAKKWNETGLTFWRDKQSWQPLRTSV